MLCFSRAQDGPTSPGGSPTPLTSEVKKTLFAVFDMSRICNSGRVHSAFLPVLLMFSPVHGIARQEHNMEDRRRTYSINLILRKLLAISRESC